MSLDIILRLLLYLLVVVVVVGGGGAAAAAAVVVVAVSIFIQHPVSRQPLLVCDISPFMSSEDGPAFQNLDERTERNGPV